MSTRGAVQSGDWMRVLSRQKWGDLLKRRSARFIDFALTMYEVLRRIEMRDSLAKSPSIVWAGYLFLPLLVLGESPGCRSRGIDQAPREPHPELLCSLGGHDGGVNTLLFASAGRLLVCGGDDGRIRVWDTQMRQQTVVIQAHVGPVRSICVTTDGK